MPSKYFHSFDGMCWPLPAEGSADLSWRLRFVPESVTDNEKLVLASVIDAYRELIVISDTRRRPIVRALRVAMGKTQSEEGSRA